jgi:membrane-associated phospholipid phosphatase
MISGFPSLHIAVVLTGSVYLSHIHWAVAFLSWIFVLLTINSTLYLGWHYLLDDVGAVALVYISYVLTSRMSWSWKGKVEYASIVSREG